MVSNVNSFLGINKGLGNSQCTGCFACVEACPKQCISMIADMEGFLYPVLKKEDDCLNCGICKKVCQLSNTNDRKVPLRVMGAINLNEDIRFNSSSGGVFYAVAEKIIDMGGVVFGAQFNDDLDVEMNYSNSCERIKRFMGSKYVQSFQSDIFRKVEYFLKEERWVLFSGVHCQISGLKHYLNKEYPKLLCIDCVCHSIPSPLVWKRYKGELGLDKRSKVNFRDKSTGWSNYYSLSYQVDDNSAINKIPRGGAYMRGLVSNLTTRPSCATCPAKNGKSGADMTIGDYWGIGEIEPEKDDNKGTSIVVIYTNKGLEVLSSLNLNFFNANIEKAQLYNGGLREPVRLHERRKIFFKKLRSTDSVSLLIEKMLLPTIWQKICGIISKI